MKIANFRAFEEEQVIDFAIPNGIPGSGLTILVGPNNSGKTTTLETIAQYFSGNKFEAPRETRRGNAEIKIRMTFDDRLPRAQRFDSTLQPIETSAGKIGGTQSTYFLGANNISKRIEYIRANRTFKDSVDGQLDMSDYKAFANTNRMQRLKALAHDETLATEIKLKAEGGIIHSSISSMKDTVKKILATDGTVSTDLEFGNHILTFKEKHQNHRLNQQGSGVQNTTAIASILDTDKTILLFDEPETSLHPQAQKRMFDLLHKLTANIQIIVATHSPYLVNWSTVKYGKVHRLTKDKAGSARIRSLSRRTLSKLESIVSSDLKNRKLYDIVSREIFFCDTGIVFCEGQEDVIYIENYLTNDNDSPNLRIPFFGYGSGGSGNIYHWLKMAQELGITAAGLYDSDENAHVEAVKSDFSGDPSIAAFQITQPDIRDKFETDARGKKVTPNKIKKEGVFLEIGKIKPKEKDGFDAVLMSIYEHLQK